MIKIKKLIETVNSEAWDIVESTEETLIFTTGRHEYSITKRALKGYIFTELSTNRGTQSSRVFDTPEDLIDFITENKVSWEEKVMPFNGVDK